MALCSICLVLSPRLSLGIQRSRTNAWTKSVILTFWAWTQLAEYQDTWEWSCSFPSKNTLTLTYATSSFVYPKPLPSWFTKSRKAPKSYTNDIFEVSKNILVPRKVYVRCYCIKPHDANSSRAKVSCLYLEGKDQKRCVFLPAKICWFSFPLSWEFLECKPMV